MRGLRLLGRLLLVALLVAAPSLIGCTTIIQPVTCEGGPYRCSPDSRDVKFCENEAIEVEGADCAALGIAPSKPFCVVTPSHTRCVDTNYEVKDRDCKVLKYRTSREWRVCSPGTPTFAR
jgi:hypothetical protein